MAVVFGSQPKVQVPMAVNRYLAGYQKEGEGGPHSDTPGPRVMMISTIKLKLDCLACATACLPQVSSSCTSGTSRGRAASWATSLASARPCR